VRCLASWSGGWWRPGCTGFSACWRARAAREAIWDRYLAAMPHNQVDMAAIVEESRLFTPADIEFAARRTAQLAFERVLFEGGGEEVTAADILHAIGQTRRTLTPELVAEFEQDIQDYARV
jgi:transitional endoplasmic reticulum ATPase